MDNKELMAYIDNQRWLMNNGLFSESAKNQLFMYGSIVHPDIRAVELDIDVESKELNYTIYVPYTVLKKVHKYNRLSKATGFWGLRSFKKFLKKEGDLNLKAILMGFVLDYCGPSWQINLEIEDYKNYSEDQGEQQGDQARNTPDTQTN